MSVCVFWAMSVAEKDVEDGEPLGAEDADPVKAIANYQAQVADGQFFFFVLFCAVLPRLDSPTAPALKVAAEGRASSKLHERAVMRLGTLLAARGDVAALRALLEGLRPLFAVIPKVRTAKLVRHLVKALDSVPGAQAKAVELEVVQSTMAWADAQGNPLLRQSLATQLAALYFANDKYQQALEQLGTILREVKRLDDKQLQVEIQLLESRVQHALHNVPKARAALTAARTAANAIYCPPLTQAQIDMQAGVLHAEEKDYKTAYSYFYECFEGYSMLEDATATKALKYMLLCKIMTNASEDIAQILNNKLALRCAGRDVEAMRAVAAAYKARSLKEFASVQQRFHGEIEGDVVVHAHLQQLYDNLLEQNLLRIIEPYSCVEIAHVAALIALPVQHVERKLSQMILDKLFEGVLDAAAGCLHVYEAAREDTTFTGTLETMAQMNKVVSSLFENTVALSH